MWPCDVWIVIEAHWEKINHDDEQEWQRIRYLAYMVHIHSHAKNKIRTIEAFLPLPTDKNKFKSTYDKIAAYKEKVAKLRNTNG